MIAIITGASSGLGREYVDAVLKSYPSVDEIWIIARRKENLKEIAEAHSRVTIAAISLDLELEESFLTLEKLIREREPDIKVLVNCAGYGKTSDFFISDKKTQLGMINLNCIALTALTRICMPYMADDSAIINVSSIAGCFPLPGMAVFSATKSYVIYFSKALRQELRPRGINVIAACPGRMMTEFYDTAYTQGGSSKAIESLPEVPPKTFAERSVRAARHGKSFYTFGIFYKFYHLLSKLLPHSLLMKLMNI